MMEVVIGYGSETGNAQETADYLHRECVYHDLKCTIHPLNDFTLQTLQNTKLAIFVCSTTGDGEEPKNMKKFWRSLLQRSLSRETFSNLHFSVLGLGDSSYAKFNYVAKRLFRRLESLGAIPVHVLGLADDQHPQGAEYISFNWITSLLHQISEKFSLSLTRNYRQLPPKYIFTINTEHNIENDNISNTTLIQDVVKHKEVSKEYPYESKMISNRRVTSSDHFQDVRVVEFDVSESGIVYKPGDVVWVYPQNSEETVREAAAQLQLDLNSTLTLTSTSHPAHLPSTLSIRQLLTSHLDLTSQPSRYFFEVCANFAAIELEREKFVEFTTLEGQEELFSYVSRPRRTILEVLGDFHSVRENIDTKYLFDIIPLIKPRGFSIASSQSNNRDSIEICMAVVRYRTNMKTERLGLCSTWLSNLPLQSPVKLFVESGSFHFPTDRPIIMVGPGTGCAPFRSLIQDRSHTPQPLLLFFGCRGQHTDYFFKEEWEGLPNVSVVTACSRDQEHKVYVQHRLVEHAPRLWRLLCEEGAVFCLAGNSKNMPLQVKEAVMQVAQTAGKLSPEESREFVEHLIKTKRYQTETW